MAKKKKEFYMDDRGWVCEDRALNIEPPKPKFVSSNLGPIEQEALERLKKRFGNNAASIIRRSLISLDQAVSVSEGED